MILNCPFLKRFGQGPDFLNMLAIFLLMLICKLEVETLMHIKMSSVFCVNGGSEGQNPLTLAIRQRHPKWLNSGLQVNADLLPPERGAALPFHFPVSTKSAAELCGLSCQIPCHFHLAY